MRKLKRRKNKISQYHSGILRATRYIRCVFAGTSLVPHVWATNPHLNAMEQEFALEDSAHEASSHQLVEPLTPDALEELSGTAPNLADSWAASHSVHARVHAEIRIIIHLKVPYYPGESSQAF